MSEARAMLDLAARAASRAEGRVEPNPLVGAVLVRDGAVLAIGHHRRFGGPHAERDALAACARLGIDPRGSTLYVTLEPCRHFGKTPPCTDAIIASGIARVVYACPDPAPVSGGGAEVLRAHAIDARECVESRAAIELSEPFRRRLASGLPWVIAKWAQTIDARTATSAGQSRWISSPASRRRAHLLRARTDAIVVGVGTVLADDPSLTVRLREAGSEKRGGARGGDLPRLATPRRTPTRVVLDSSLRTPISSTLANTARATPTLVVAGRGCFEPSRRDQLVAAGARVIEADAHQGRLEARSAIHAIALATSAATLLVEGGPTLLGSLLDADLIDEAIVHVAPTLMGDAEALPALRGRAATSLDALRRFRLVRHHRVGDDLELAYRRSR